MADFLYPDYCDTLELIHEVLSGVNLGGPGFIEGIVSQGAGRALGDPVPGVEIVLMDANEDPVQYTKTDEDGEFRFENLVSGDYCAYVDRWLIQNNIAPMITLTEEYNEVDDLEFILHSNRLELIKPKGIGESSSAEITIYPNPSNGIISVMSSRLVSSVKVTDVLGWVKFNVNPNAQQFNVNIDGLSQGIYFIEMYHGDTLIGQQKIVLQK